MKKLIALILTVALVAPGPLLAKSVEDSVHGEDALPQAININVSPIFNSDPVNLESDLRVPNESLLNIENSGIENRAIKIQNLTAAPHPNPLHSPLAKRERAGASERKMLRSGLPQRGEGIQIRRSNRTNAKLSGFIQSTRKAISVKRAKVASALSGIFDHAKISGGAVTPAPGKISSQKNQLLPWHKMANFPAAASSVGAVTVANAVNTPAVQAAAFQPFSIMNLTYITMAVIAVATGYWFLRERRNIKARDEAAAQTEGVGTGYLPPITFADIAGQDEAIAKVKKIIDAFKNPSKYQRLNKKFQPRNAALLIGPPGTGKTILAEAIANEMGIEKDSLFKTNGGDFMEKYVGVGPRAVRDLFDKARNVSRGTKRPAMIFIDEIDGLGRRGGGDAGDGDEKRMTIDALLSEMNALSGPDYNIFLIGATNEFGKMDTALTRNGRFGTHIILEKPDLEGREAILKVHAKEATLSADVNFHKIAERTAGFSGADMGTVGLLGAATEIATERGASSISQEDFEKAVEITKENNVRQKSETANSSNEDKAHNVSFEDPENITTTFADIAGQDEAKTEIMELVDQIKNRDKYLAINPRYRPIRGALLFGPPGTGKTLIARAIAKESGALFFQVNATELIKSLVGKGPQAIRDVFAKVNYESTREKKPAILFLDEIEAVGRARGSDASGHGDTLVNELLTALDGFKTSNNVTVIGATNKPESLDPALTRGGRIELQIPIGKPDVVGREAILKIHATNISLAPDVNLRKVAEQTAGFVGADLESLVMKATALSVKRGSKSISQEDFIASIDRVQLGLERKIAMSADEKQVVAYHEAGHALVSHLLPDADPIRKVTIVPHGLNALGLMQAMSDVERTLQSRSYFVARMAVAMGGRAGEELMSERLNGKPENFSGAANDLEKTSEIARYMVMKFGMSKKIGLVSYGFTNEQQAQRPLSETTNKAIEAEIKLLVQEAYSLARTTLESNWDVFKAAAEELRVKETLRGEDFDRLVPKAKNPPPPPHA